MEDISYIEITPDDQINIRLPERKKLTKEDYNNIPVYYCNHCMSLNVGVCNSEFGTAVCNNCGSMNIVIDHIDNWSLENEKRNTKENLFKNIKKWEKRN